MFNFSKVDNSKSIVNEYKVTGSRKPTEKEPNPQIFTLRLFAKNVTHAESQFSHQLKQQYKIKPSKTKLWNVEKIEHENDFKVKNYIINFTFKTKTETFNARNDIRHVSVPLAVSALLTKIGSRHRVKVDSIFIRDVREAKSIDELVKDKAITYSAENLKFPLFIKTLNTDRDCVPVSTNLDD